ncbi:MAG: hypothetical protein U0842_23420 [Candidatus Binatia bacterium]
MNPSLAQALLAAAGIYLGAGCAFAAWFVVAGVGRIDPAAASAGAGFRVLLVPGAAALWPLLARRLRAGGYGLPEQHDAHTDAARAFRGDA